MTRNRTTPVAPGMYAQISGCNDDDTIDWSAVRDGTPWRIGGNP